MYVMQGGPIKDLVISDIECTSQTFKCMDGIPACIPSSWVCDGHRECLDGSDESPDICGEQIILTIREAVGLTRLWYTLLMRIM